jgi:ACR3 family arsenite efflux pump ArsB
MGDAQTLNGSPSRRPLSVTWLTRYLPGFLALAIASASVLNAVFPSFHVMERLQNVANLKNPALLRVAVVCMMPPELLVVSSEQAEHRQFRTANQQQSPKIHATRVNHG